MLTRKHRLIDCNPVWATDTDRTCFLIFECPEGHDDCKHVIPFTPSLEGADVPSPQANGARWNRLGDTFETVTFTPSIRRMPRYATREAAIADGCIAEHVTASMLCALHIFINAGRIDFCGDSR